MIKSVVYCDFCEKPLPYADPCVVTLYKTKEFDTHEKFPHMCESCARKIDDIIRDYKADAAHKASLASMFAQINKERKERLGTEG